MSDYTINGKPATAKDWSTIEEYLKESPLDESDWQELLSDNDLSRKDALKLLDKNGDGFIHELDDDFMLDHACDKSKAFKGVLKRFNLRYANEEDEVPKSFKGQEVADTEGKFIERIEDDDRVVIIGEHHPDVESKRMLAAKLKEFRKKGFTHLGLEMIPASMQPMLDKYFETGEGADEIKAYLEEHWEGYTDDGEYFQIVEAAKAAGLRIVGLDMDDHGPSTDTEIEGDRAMRKRNITMARSIDKITSDPSNRIVCLCGMGHVIGNISQHLKEAPAKQFHFERSMEMSSFDDDLFEDMGICM